MKVFLISLIAAGSCLACLNDGSDSPLLNTWDTTPGAIVTLLQKALDSKAVIEVKLRAGTARQEADAVRMVLAGERKKGIAELKKLAAAEPNSYSIAANLGTSYELDGQDAEALKWIKRSIEINPLSHGGTEWVHVLILEAKLMKGRDAAVSPLIPLPNKELTEDMVIDVGGEQRTLPQILDALVYQLQERMTLVKPKDAIVAEMLSTVSRIEGELRTPEQGLLLLRMAQTYGAESHFERVLLAKIQRRQNRWAFTKSIPFVAVVLLTLLWVGRRLKRRGHA
jgi:hypothetical protein